MATIKFGAMNEELERSIRTLSASAGAVSDAFKHLGSAMTSAATTLTSFKAMHTTTVTPDYRTESIKFVYDFFPQFLGHKLASRRRGYADEDTGKFTPGPTQYEAHYGTNEKHELGEIIHLSCFRRDLFTVHAAYADGVERMVRVWSKADHDELCAFIVKGGGASVGIADIKADLDRKRRDELERQLQEKEVLAEKARLAAENKRREVAEAKRRAEEEAEIELAVSFETRAANPGFASW
jgi:hypothetical protein